MNHLRKRLASRFMSLMQVNLLTDLLTLLFVRKSYRVQKKLVANWLHQKNNTLVLAVLKPNTTLTRDELIKFFDGKVAKWMMPDDVVFVDQLPHTATGKLLKTKLREEYKNYKLPN